MVDYYDGILGGIGTLLMAGVVAAVAFGSMMVLPFAALAIGLVAHAMFLHPPVDKPTEHDSNALSSDSPVAAD